MKNYIDLRNIKLKNLKKLFYNQNFTKFIVIISTLYNSNKIMTFVTLVLVFLEVISFPNVIKQKP